MVAGRINDTFKIQRQRGHELGSAGSIEVTENGLRVNLVGDEMQTVLSTN